MIQTTHSVNLWSQLVYHFQLAKESSCISGKIFPLIKAEKDMHMPGSTGWKYEWNDEVIADNFSVKQMLTNTIVRKVRKILIIA